MSGRGRKAQPMAMAVSISSDWRSSAINHGLEVVMALATFRAMSAVKKQTELHSSAQNMRYLRGEGGAATRCE